MLYDASESPLRIGSIFKKDSEYISYLLMKYIHEDGAAVGAWTLREKLLAHGIDRGTATIGRYLKSLDSMDYTITQGNQGRLLTPRGVARFHQIEKALQQAELQNSITATTQIHEYQDLIDLLYVRRILETETAALAAEYATEKELNQLQEALEAHERCVAANNDPTETALIFHQTIADICHNKFLQALMQFLIYKETEIECTIESLVSRELGPTYVVEHEAITKAICSHDAQQAGQLMSQHVYTIYSDVDQSVRI